MASKALVAASLKPFVLTILSEGPSYGYEIIKRVSRITEGHVEWTTGTLYPLLHTLENKGLLKSFWREAGPGPKRKYYRITTAGETELARERGDWIRVNAALVALWGDSVRLKTT